MLSRSGGGTGSKCNQTPIFILSDEPLARPGPASLSRISACAATLLSGWKHASGNISRTNTAIILRRSCMLKKTPKKNPRRQDGLQKLETFCRCTRYRRWSRGGQSLIDFRLYQLAEHYAPVEPPPPPSFPSELPAVRVKSPLLSILATSWSVLQRLQQERKRETHTSSTVAAAWNCREE